MAYPAIFAPFIPMWFIGEEWNNPKKNAIADPALYFNAIDWAALDIPANRAFYEDVKNFIRIRRSHPEIFEFFPDNHRETNLVKVEAEGNPLESYARFRNGKAIIVVPNNSAAEKTFKVHVPFGTLGMADAKRYKITDLLNGKRVAEQDASALTAFKAAVQPDSVGVYLVVKRE
jgi:pullulanase/glycogen debranching enzyme